MSSPTNQQSRFEYEDFALPPAPTAATIEADATGPDATGPDAPEADLPLPPPIWSLVGATGIPPSGRIMAPQPMPYPSVSREIIDMLPRGSIYRADISSDDYELHRQWFTDKFRQHIIEFPRLQEHFVRMHAGGGTPDNPYAIDWANMVIIDNRSMRTQAIKLLQNNRDEERNALEESIKRASCFAIYHREQAPYGYTIPDYYYRSYMHMAWTWNEWLSVLDLTEE